MSEDENKSRANRMMDDLVSEGLEQSAPGPAAGPILPRMRLIVSAAAAPMTVTRRKPGRDLPKKPASEMLPEILREVDEARRKAAEQRSKDMAANAAPGQGAAAGSPGGGAAAAAQEGSALEPMPGSRQAKGMSRVRRRFSLVYGKPHAAVFRPKRSETVQAGLHDKVIYQVTREEKPLRVVQSWWERPGFTTFAFLAPALTAFLLFAWLPMARGLLLSFQKVSLVGESTFVGADNYVRAFNDPLFWATFAHALLFCALSLGLGFWLPVALSITMNELKRFQGWLRFAFFLPFLTPTVPAVILWRWILDQGYGVLNSILAMLGMPNPHVPWLNQPMLAMLSVVIVFLWKNTGWNALIYLTALREVPEELYEAAELDGASVRTRVRHVSFPALKTTMGVLLIMQVINSFQIFTEVYLLTQGGPMASTEVIATYLYKKSFLYLDIGYASALAVMLFVVLVSFTGLRMKTIEQEA